jgi:thioredoxin 1
MKKLVLLLIMLATTLFIANVIGDPFSYQKNTEKGLVVEITQLEQLNAFVQEKPVFLKIGASWCSHCQAMKPILEKMAAEYAGSATIATIDIDKSPEFSKYFGVEMIPDSCVIVGIKNGAYVYMQENGALNTDRSQARFIGLNESSGPNEETFEKVLNLAVQNGKDRIK